MANKAALEAEKARDELHNQIEQIEEQLHPKRARTHDDAHECMGGRIKCGTTRSSSRTPPDYYEYLST